MNVALRPAIAPTVPAKAGPVLCVSNLFKSFGTNDVLRGIDLTVAPGIATALIGANGSGKSTALKCLIRLVEPTSGKIELLGRDVLTMNPRDLRRFRSTVGVVWQKHNLVPRLSALTNVIHGVQARTSGPRTWFQSLATAEMRTEALACLDRVGLSDKALERVDSLSGGQQQRVAIARMLMQRPQIILADEPDASLDPQSGEEVMRILSGLARQDGLTLIFISHRMEHTLEFSDHILGLQGGHIVMNRATAQTDATHLRRFFDHQERT
ncbi:ABC transporter [Gemmobacter aquarius]|uniref:ABC transporter n=1 Tax=Paragemmobacter aquarius TaxID=2169400 RepID=A0A2S0UP16_9RHOB|nr:ATP-binding cassette domain-containing protein [Gemmobacter aquarius]AWB49530.1 ABC transporter [Gemmobacter aquarius]